MPIRAQTIERFNSFSYSVNEGLLQSTMADIAVDKNNFCWISFPIGIQKFDGKNFTNIPVQAGLPDNKAARFFKCKNGDLLITHSGGISKYEIDRNGFSLLYKNAAGQSKSLIFIGEDEGIIYFLEANGTVTGIHRQNGKVMMQAKTELLNYISEANINPPVFSENIINHKVGINVNYKLYLWHLKEGRVLAASDALPDMSGYMLRLKNDHEILYYLYKINNGLQLYNFSTKKNSNLFIKGKDDTRIDRCNIFTWKNRLIINFNNRLFEIDTFFTKLETELVDFQNLPLAGTYSIAGLGIKEDNYGNLYIQTVNGGLKKIIGNNYPVKYYGTLKKEDNNILSILPDKKNNRILVGTVNNGLLVFDTTQRLVKHIKTMPGSIIPFSANCILKNGRGNYLLFNVGEKQVWVLNSDLSVSGSIPIASQLPENKKSISYFGNFLFQNETAALTQSQGKLYKTSFTSNSVKQYEISTRYIMGGLLYDHFIITHANDKLVYVDTATFTEVKKIAFENTGNVRCFTKDKDNNIYIGSNNGIYKIDGNGKILQHLTTQDGLPDDCIYAMAFDDGDDLWCSTNKGIFRLNKNNSIFQLKKEDGLQENEFNTNVVARADDGELFFGGVNGVSSFYPASIGSFDEKINLFFTSVKINNEEAFKDTAVWNIRDINLPHDQNSLSFDFIAMANNNPGQYVYQYKMESIDKEWIQNTDLQTVRYFLPPGDYVFKIYASRFFDKEAKAMKEIRITIHPPFWKTWWFITGIILLLFAGLAYAVNSYNKVKYQKRLDVLESEHKIQLERERISRDLHDSIGAYANAVLYNTELLQKENDAAAKNLLMKDLKFASKDIITSLRETVWALKKDNYTEEECLLRIKNFIQALARYYPYIQFKAEGEASAEKILHHTKALHVVRIVQEAVTNAIKHAAAVKISLSSNQREGKWELTVVDEGRGFDYEMMKQAEQGNGLINMKQRADESGIVFTVTSEVNAGTRVSILV